jgi:cell wall assembly regulator SMI1
MNSRKNLGELLRQIDEVRWEVGRLDPDLYPYYPPNPPASPEEIERLEEHFRTRLPEEFKELLLHCNGWPHLVAGIDLLSVEEMMEEPGKECWNWIWKRLEPLGLKVSTSAG